MNRLILGRGLLGKELSDKTGWDYLYRERDQFDFSDIYSYKDRLQYYDEIVNCIAYTDTYSNNMQKNWDVNYKGVADLCDFCTDSNKKLIHISTSYVYAHSKSNATEEDPPVPCATWYGVTKLLADSYIILRSKSYLIIRTIFKEYPFKYDTAFSDIMGNFDYVSVIADLILKLIENGALGVYNVGTEAKSMYELACRYRKDVKPTSCTIDNMPLDTTMDLSKMKAFFKAKGIQE